MLTQSRVKICGITSVEDARIAHIAGADAIGMVFYQPSPRNIVDFTLAKDIALAVGPFVTVVALTVDASTSFIERLLKEVPVNTLQFHGDEDASFCEQFKMPYVKALRMKQGVDVQDTISRYGGASAILLDTYVKGVPGGTGETFNWDSVPLSPAKPIILAGGLSPQNVGVAIKIAEPYAVDVSGGVESEPGIKDQFKVSAFIENAKLECSSDD